MSSYTDVKNLIISNIKANGQREITGPILQDVLLNMLENSSRVEEITYSDLKALRDGAKLTPSRLYRITDYITTTVQSNTKSARHPFDVIVLALSESELLEQAWAIQHEGDEYFTNSNLSDWELWYCLDNDTDRFDWADATNGKGVIYRMIDEFNNDVPYDFKNIQFYRQWDSSKSLWSTISSDNTGVPCYTFSSEGSSSTTTFTDYSLSASNGVYSNVIKGHVNGIKKTLNNNCFFGTGCSSNSFGERCRSNTFGGPRWCSCTSNTFGTGCYNNTFNTGCTSNTFGNNCKGNTFGNSCDNNTFGNSCNNNVVNSNCTYNTFGNYCGNNTFGNSCNSNTFGDECTSNTFEYDCTSNTFGDECTSNTFGEKCSNNIFMNECINNTFNLWCNRNIFGNDCQANTFNSSCNYNSFGSSCSANTFGRSCNYNSFGSSCSSNIFGANYNSNSFGNHCSYNSFRVNPRITSSLKNYVYYNHFDDGCSYNVIWNSKTTSSSTLLKNVNVNRGVAGTESSYNMINIDVLNSEQEINVNQFDRIVSIGNILSIKYESLKTLRDNSQLIPGQQYRIIDYITTTAQENTKSAGHQFDIIVTALDESTLSEEAQAIQNSNDRYFDDSNLSAWKIWYCLDNDTNRFVWAGDNVKVDEIEHKKYDSSQCTINPELINGNEFIPPFNFESCVWVDGNNDSEIPYDTHHHDISELIYEWGYFNDENGDTQLCIYKSDADLYAEEGHPDYGDKYLYRGVVNVDGVEYDYWQKWDANGDGVYINGGDDYVYATTKRIVSNPEAYSATIETEGIYVLGKGVIYRMIDEWNNDCPYDFKNIQYNGSWGYWAYTFNWINDDSDNTCEDLSVAQYAHTNDEGGYSHTCSNIIKPCETGDAGDYGFPLRLNACAFLNTESYDGGMYYGCSSNIFGNNCYNNTFRNKCSYNSFGDSCSSNTIGDNCFFNSFGNDCSGNIFGTYCHDNIFRNKCSYNSFGERCSINVLDPNCYNNTFGNEFFYNTFGNDCTGNTFGNDCNHNTFGNTCSNNTFNSVCHHNTFGSSCHDNTFAANCNHNTFGSDCYNNAFSVLCDRNTFGSGCQGNIFGNDCDNNTFGNDCQYIQFASIVKYASGIKYTKYHYYRNNHFGDGCRYILFRGTETASTKAQVQNYNFSQGLQGTSDAYLTIDGVRNLSYEAKVAKNSKGEIKIYCEADLIA